MTANSHWRGHPIYWDGECWRYKDNNEPTAGADRTCGACGLHRTGEGHDGCLGTLPGVTNACCGHGKPHEAYIQFEDGSEARGWPAIEAMDQLIENREVSDD